MKKKRKTEDIITCESFIELLELAYCPFWPQKPEYISSSGITQLCVVDPVLTVRMAREFIKRFKRAGLEIVDVRMAPPEFMWGEETVKNPLKNKFFMRVIPY